MENDQSRNVIPSKRWMRFGLRSMLLFALLIAVWLSAFRLGRSVGLEEGEESGFAKGISARVYPSTYRITDLLMPLPDGQANFVDYQSLMDEIVINVQPESWESAGGPATLAPYPQNLSLVVSQTARGHKALSEFLAAKRE